MKSLNEYIINEAKFMNFTPAEMKQYDKECEEYEKLYNGDNNYGFYHLFYVLEPLKVSSMEDYNKIDIEYGKKYILRFRNPYVDGSLSAEQDTDGDKPKPLEEGPEFIFCVGIGDKFGNIHIANSWGKNKTTVFWRNKPFYLKMPEYSLYEKKGWYALIKDLPCYLVKFTAGNDWAERFNEWWAVYPVKQKNAYVKLKLCAIAEESKVKKCIEKGW